MNIAFAALAILTLAIPGALFLAIYRGSSRGIPASSINFQQYLVAYVFLSILLHLALAAFATYTTGSEVQHKTLLYVLTGWEPPAERIDLVAEQLVGPSGATLWYIIYSFLASCVLGRFARGFVRFFYLDLLFGFVRPHSEWHYLFSGEIEAIKAARIKGTLIEKWKQIADWQTRRVNVAAVAVVIEQGGVAQLYWGELYDWYAEGDKLERLVLKTAQRRELERDQKENEADENPIHSPRFYPIKGDYLVIEAKDITTLNLYYYRMKQQPPASV